MKPAVTFLGGAVAGIVGLLAFQHVPSSVPQPNPTASQSGVPLAAADLPLSLDRAVRRVSYDQPLFVTDQAGTEYRVIFLGRNVGSPLEYQWEGTSDRSRRGRGRLFEKYEKVEKAPGEFQLRDQGSELSFRIEDLRLRWSSGGPDGGWIYFEPGQVTVSDPSGSDGSPGLDSPAER
jgi:hypothetical protein